VEKSRRISIEGESDGLGEKAQTFGRSYSLKGGMRNRQIIPFFNLWNIEFIPEH
jgi:hypothetical protein